MSYHGRSRGRITLTVLWHGQTTPTRLTLREGHYVINPLDVSLPPVEPAHQSWNLLVDASRVPQPTPDPAVEAVAHLSALGADFKELRAEYAAQRKTDMLSALLAALQPVS